MGGPKYNPTKKLGLKRRSTSFTDEEWRAFAVAAREYPDCKAANSGRPKINNFVRKCALLGIEVARERFKERKEFEKRKVEEERLARENEIKEAHSKLPVDIEDGTSDGF